MKTSVTKEEILAKINEKYGKHFIPASVYRITPVTYDEGGVILEVLDSFSQSQGNNFYLNWTKDLELGDQSEIHQGVAISIRRVAKEDKENFESILESDVDDGHRTFWLGALDGSKWAK